MLSTVDVQVCKETLKSLVTVEKTGAFLVHPAARAGSIRVESQRLMRDVRTPILREIPKVYRARDGEQVLQYHSEDLTWEV